LTGGSGFLINAMTIDRFLIVRFPFRVNELCTLRRTWITSACMITGPLIIFLPVLWSHKAVYNSDTGMSQCVYYSGNTSLEGFISYSQFIFSWSYPLGCSSYSTH
jgi:hypothetical protein